MARAVELMAKKGDRVPRVYVQLTSKQDVLAAEDMGYGARWMLVFALPAIRHVIDVFPPDVDRAHSIADGINVRAEGIRARQNKTY